MDIAIRPARAGDVGDIVELVKDGIGEEDAIEADLVLRDREFDRDRWLVAADGSKVLSTAAIFPGRLRVGEVEVAAGAIEFVATEDEYQGQGLVRRLMNELHRTAPQRGEMVQWIVGITYFYRKFGYEYAIPVGGMHAFDASATPQMPPGWTGREALTEEVDDVADAVRRFSLTADVALTADNWMWSVYHRSPSYGLLIAEGPSEIAMGRVYSYEDDRYLTDIVAASSEGAAALVSTAAEEGSWDVTVMSRPGARRHLDELSPYIPAGDAYYLRATDPVDLLEAMRPELSRRLGAAGKDTIETDALISLYGSSIRFSVAEGKVGSMRREGPVPGPIGAGGSGVAPDLIVSLLLGPLGAAGLAARHADVNLGEQAELMEALFPPQTCDVHSWVVP